MGEDACVATEVIYIVETRRVSVTVTTLGCWDVVVAVSSSENVVGAVVEEVVSSESMLETTPAVAVINGSSVDVGSDVDWVDA